MSIGGNNSCPKAILNGKKMSQALLSHRPPLSGASDRTGRGRAVTARGWQLSGGTFAGPAPDRRTPSQPVTFDVRPGHPAGSLCAASPQPAARASPFTGNSHDTLPFHTQNESAPLRGRSVGVNAQQRQEPAGAGGARSARAGAWPQTLRAGGVSLAGRGDRQSGLQVLVAAGSASVPRPACSPRRAPFPEAPACRGWGCRAAGQSDLGPLVTAAPVAIPSLKRHVPVGRAAGPAGPPCPERRPGSEEPGTRPPRPAQSKASHPAPRHDAAPHSRLHPHRPHHTPCQRSARTGSSLQVAEASTPTNASPAE